MNIQWKGSPNSDNNRKPIKYIVIHWFGDSSTSSNAINGVNNQFQKTGGTSAHYAVENETIFQFVQEDKVAYHAGVYSANQESIGIEHSAGPNRNASDATYETSAQLIADIWRRRGKMPLRKHSEFKATQCCGSVDLGRLERRANEILNPAPPSDPCADVKKERDALSAGVIAGKAKIDELTIELNKQIGNSGTMTKRIAELESQLELEIDANGILRGQLEKSQAAYDKLDGKLAACEAKPPTIITKPAEEMTAVEHFAAGFRQLFKKKGT